MTANKFDSLKSGKNRNIALDVSKTQKYEVSPRQHDGQ
jgi:hypothetical protein